MKNLKKLKRDLRRSKFGLDEMTILGAIFTFVLCVVGKTTIGFETTQYFVYGLTLVTLLFHVLKYRGKLDGNAIGLLSWVEKYKWRGEKLSVKISYVLQILSVIFVLTISSLFAFKYLDSNWLFWLIVGIVFFSITGVGIIWLIVFTYRFVINDVWNPLNRFYYARLCQSLSKIENNIKKTLVYSYEKEDVNERRITIIQAWKAIQKLGTLQEILNFWIKNKVEISEGHYLSLKVMTVLSNKMRKEDLSYQLNVFPILLDWFVEFNNLSISTLRINPDKFVKINQSFFDLLIENLPTYNGKIYLNLEMQEIKIRDIIVTIYTEFTAYMKDSDAVRSGDIREQFEIDKNVQSDLFHANQTKVALKDNVLNKPNIDSLGDNLAELLVDPDNIITPSDIQKVVEQQEIFLIQEKYLSEFVKKIKSGDISVCSGTYYNGYELINGFPMAEKHLDEFLNNVDIENELRKRITVIQTKQRVDFNGKAIQNYLEFLFHQLVKSTDDEIIKKIIKILHESLIYLESFSSSDLKEFVFNVLVAWLDSKKAKEALMIEAIISIAKNHQKVVNYVIRRKIC